MNKNIANDPFPVMEHMTVKMVREYLTRSKSIILPMGVIEQHGYHLPLKTDTILANHIGRMVGEQTGIIVAPTIHQSFSGGDLPGTINISPAVMSLVVRDTLVSLAAQGFRNFYLLLCHGGSENARALDNALKLLLRLNPMFENALIALMPTWKFRPDDDNSLDEGDWHAGWNETSRIMALEPELVRMDELELDAEPLMKLMAEHPDNYQRAEKIVDDEFVVPRMSQKPDIKVGVMGRPEKASPEIGRKLIEGIVKGMSDKVLELEAKADGVYKEVAFTPEPLIIKK